MRLLRRFLSTFALNLDSITRHITFTPFRLAPVVERILHACACADDFPKNHGDKAHG
jgi:hypothetical protein